MDDLQLVQATLAGDGRAGTMLFDRYAAPVHDLAFATLRDRPLAAEVLQATFDEAVPRLSGLQEGHRLAVWLLAVTRRNAALRAGATAGPDRRPTLTGHDPDRDHLVILVWEAVADLPLRDRTLIDLTLRQGLQGQDLADALGLSLSQTQELELCMRNQIEAGLVGYLIDRATQGRCPALTKALRGWDGRFTREGSVLIANHAELCADCSQSRRELPSPFTLYAEAPSAPVPAPVELPEPKRFVLRITDPPRGKVS